MSYPVTPLDLVLESEDTPSAADIDCFNQLIREFWVGGLYGDACIPLEAFRERSGYYVLPPALQATFEAVGWDVCVNRDSLYTTGGSISVCPRWHAEAV